MKIDDYEDNLKEAKSFDKNISDEELFGRLLNYFRENKQMHSLVICRNIDHFVKNGDVVEISSSDNNIYDELNNQDIQVQIKEFLKLYGLGLKIIENTKIDTGLEQLKQLFGNKLQVK